MSDTMLTAGNTKSILRRLQFSKRVGQMQYRVLAFKSPLSDYDNGHVTLFLNTSVFKLSKAYIPNAIFK